MTRNEIMKSWEEQGLYCDTWRPGDGITRYRFTLNRVDYFADSGIYTALGWKEANAFATGFLLAK